MERIDSTSALSPDGRRKLTWLALVLILGAGAMLRAHELGRAELWGDEILYLRMSDPALTPAGVVAEHLRSYSYIGHLPASALLTHVGLRLEGVSSLSQLTPASARTPSFVLGVLTLLVLAAWASRVMGGGDGALAGAAVAAFSYAHIWYSREAYHYAGQLLFAVLTLLAYTVILLEPLRGRPRIAWWVLFAAAALALTFSHPTGGGLLGALALVALGAALTGGRREARGYVVAVVCAGSTALPLLFAGTGQSPNPCAEYLRFPAWVVAEDLLENLGWGPGLFRALLTTAATAIGALFVAKRGPVTLRLLLAAAPLVFLTVLSLGTNLPYFARYYLLTWPFFVWLAAEAIVGIARLAGAYRGVVLAGAVALLAANLAPGLPYLFALEGKPNRYEAMSALLEARLPAGAVVVWDGAHALRFIPGFRAPAKPMLYAALPDDSPTAYAGGDVRLRLERLRSSFPATAFIEWGGMEHYCARRLLGNGFDPADVERELRAIFPATETFVDPAYDRIVRAGWSVVGGVPRFADDRTVRESSNVAWKMNIYYDPGDPASVAYLPVFHEGEWTLDFAPDGSPLVLAGGAARLTLTPARTARGSEGDVELEVIGLRAGYLEVTAPGAATMTLELRESGARHVLAVRPGHQPLELGFTFRGGFVPEGEAAFAVGSIVNRPHPPTLRALTAHDPSLQKRISTSRTGSPSNSASASDRVQ